MNKTIRVIRDFAESWTLGQSAFLVIVVALVIFVDWLSYTPEGFEFIKRILGGGQ